MFVVNSAAGTVSVLNQSTGTVVATPEVGEAPAAAVYDPTDGDVFVVNSESFNVTVLNASRVRRTSPGLSSTRRISIGDDVS